VLYFHQYVFLFTLFLFCKNEMLIDIFRKKFKRNVTCLVLRFSLLVISQCTIVFLLLTLYSNKINVLKQYWTEYKAMSNLQKSSRVLKICTMSTRKHSVLHSEYSIVVLKYSDSSTSTTDEYSNPVSTHEYSRHFLWWVRLEYSLDEYID